MRCCPLALGLTEQVSLRAVVEHGICKQKHCALQLGKQGSAKLCFGPKLPLGECNSFLSTVRSYELYKLLLMDEETEFGGIRQQLGAQGLCTVQRCSHISTLSSMPYLSTRHNRI